MGAVKGPGVVPEEHAVALEPARRRVRALVDGVYVVDSERAVLLFEVGFTPRWYLPWDDVRADRMTANGRSTDTAARGPARWWDLDTGRRTIDSAAWDHPQTPPSCPSLRGFVSFEWNVMDAWFQEDEEIRVHPRDPYSRVEALASSRHVEIILDGTVLADTRSPVVLIETNGPIRYYLPPLDVRRELLVPSDSFTECPDKGRASYWHVDVGDLRYHDLFWSYEAPFRAVAGIAGHLCAFGEFVDLAVDGELIDRPDTKWAHGGPNAYTWRPGDGAWDPVGAPTWRGDDRGTHR